MEADDSVLSFGEGGVFGICDVCQKEIEGAGYDLIYNLQLLTTVDFGVYIVLVIQYAFVVKERWNTSILTY